MSSYITRGDVSAATSRLMSSARRRSEGRARLVLARLWNHGDGALVHLAIPELPESFARSVTRAQRRWLLTMGRDELAALPPGTLDATARLRLSRFYGGPGASQPGGKYARRLTFTMLCAVVGIDAGRCIAGLWAAKRIPPVESLDARRPDPEEAARVHGRQVGRLARQRQAQRANAGPHVIVFR